VGGLILTPWGLLLLGECGPMEGVGEGGACCRGDWGICWELCCREPRGGRVFIWGKLCGELEVFALGELGKGLPPPPGGGTEEGEVAL